MHQILLLNRLNSSILNLLRIYFRNSSTATDLRTFIVQRLERITLHNPLHQVNRDFEVISSSIRAPSL